MAITRAQQAKQMLQNGGRIGFFKGAQADASAGKGAMSPGTSMSGGGRDRGGSDFGQFERRQQQNQALEGKGFLGKDLGMNIGEQSSLAKFGDVIAGLPSIKFIRSLRDILPQGTRPVTTPVGGGGDGGQGIAGIPTWMRLGFSSEAEYLASLEDEEDKNKKAEEGLRLAFRADGGPIGGEFDFESARQMYGLGKLVKKVTRTVKKIAKSPIGKAAIVGAGLYGLGGGTFFGKMLPGVTRGGQGFGGFGGLSSIFGNVGDIIGGKGFGDTLAKAAGSKIGLGITAASALAGLLTPEQEEEAERLAAEEGIDIEAARNSILARAQGNVAGDLRATAFRAEGGPAEGKEPVAKKTMPLLDMGGKEMDLREEGGFVPIGRMEKADDVPARLSKNEFVFTADAVRNAGDGDVDKGAEVMYNMMKNLEAGGEVSEESQGLEGARKMFQTSQRLEEVL